MVLNCTNLKQRINCQKLQETINTKYKGKNILIYGAGTATEFLFKEFNLSGINIIGVADINFRQKNPDRYKGVKTIIPDDINKLNIDIILITAFNYKSILQYLKTFHKELFKKVEIDHILQEERDNLKKDIISLPNSISIEVTNRCNLRCIMCPTHGESLKKSPIDDFPFYMDFELFTKIIDQISFETLVCPQFQGESLMHPRFLDMCHYIDSKGIKFRLTTNALLLNKKIQHELINMENFMAICFSIDGFNKDTYEKIRIGGSYEKMLANINDFLNLNNGKISTSVNFVSQPDNENEFECFVNYWINKVDYISWAYLCENPDYLHYLTPYKYNWEPERRYACLSPFNNMIILTDGTVIPCCGDYKYKIKLGNLKNESLVEVWNGLKYNNLRELHLKENWDRHLVCKACTNWMTTTFTGQKEKSLKGDYIEDTGPYFGSISPNFK